MLLFDRESNLRLYEPFFSRCPEVGLEIQKKSEDRNYRGTFRCPEVGLGIPIKNENRNSRGTFSCPEVGLGLLKK